MRKKEVNLQIFRMVRWHILTIYYILVLAMDIVFAALYARQRNCDFLISTD